MNKYDVIIIGAGIIGVAIADELARRGVKVAILEKNLRVGAETTEGNSGIIHGGFDPTPGKLNAQLNLTGRKIFENSWFKDLVFPWKKVDSLVIAFGANESKIIEEIYQRGLVNGLSTNEVKILAKDEILGLEPNINPKVDSGLLCTASYIVDPVKLTCSLWNRAKNNNAQLFLAHEVIKITEQEGEFIILCQTETGVVSFVSKKVVNAAGHYADEIAKMVNAQDFSLVRRRGQYCILEKTEIKTLNNHIIFLIPSIYGKGVIVAPMTDGHVLVGPTAQEGIKREDTRLIDVQELKKIQEFGQKIMPKLNVKRISKLTSGSRPICQKTDDFIIRYAKNNQNFVNVAGIKSPGLTAAPAIALKVADMVADKRKEASNV